jgi:hypothetical protein
MSAPRFSIASMLLLTMVVAIVLAAVVQAVRGLPSTGPAEAFVGVTTMILGMIAGVVVAWMHCRWFVAIFLGLPAGLAIGWVVAVLIVVPEGLPVLLSGCPLVVLYGVAVRFLSRPKDHNSVSCDRSLPQPWIFLDRRPWRSGRPWGARWDTPAAGVPRRFGLGVLMLLVTLAAVLFSALRSMGAGVEVFAVISTMFAAVAVGQVFLFGGRHPRAASIWVGACFCPLQVIAVWTWLYFEYGRRSFHSLDELLFVLLGAMIFSIPVGAGLGYLSGGLVGGVFLTLDALAERRRSQRDAVEEK